MKAFCLRIGLTLIALWGVVWSSGASHLMGGDLYYEIVDSTSTSIKFKITIVVYRNCNSNTKLSNTIDVDFFDASTDKNIGTQSMTLQTQTSVVPTCIPTNSACIEEGIYECYISFSKTYKNGINLSYGRCCRNAAIDNIDQPGSNGMLWAGYIPPLKLYRNNSPKFLNKPLPFLCAGQQTLFNHNGYDPDGDSLVFALVTPYQAGSTTNPNPSGQPPPYDTVTWASGYSLSQPLGSGSSISIDPQTGEIDVTANTAGNYVIAVEVQEWRSTASGPVLMGTVRRDLQMIVRSCSNQTLPVIDYGANATKNVHAMDQLCFKITGTDTTGDSVYISATGALFDSTITYPNATFAADTADSTVTSKFCWTPSCEQIRSTPYIFTVQVSDNNCGTVYKTISVYVNKRNAMNPPDIRCTRVTSNTLVDLNWTNPTKFYRFNGYRIYRRDPGGTVFNLIRTIMDSTQTSWTDSTVTSAMSQSYTYYMSSRDLCDDEGNLGDSISTIIPTASTPDGQNVYLSWNALAKARTPYYQLYYNIGAGWVWADSTQSLKDTLTIWGCKNNVWWKIEVPDSAGGCTSLSALSDTVQIFDTIKPVNPQIKRATVNNNKSILVEWDASSSKDVIWYYLWRATNGGSYAVIDSVKSNGGTTYSRTDAAATIDNNQYQYKLQLRDSCKNYGGFSGAHRPVNLTTKAQQLSVQLTWYLYQGFAFDSIMIQRSVAGGSWANYKNVSNTDTAYLDKNLNCGVDYAYRLKFINNVTNTVYSLSDTSIATPYDTVKPAAPVFDFASVTSGSSIHLEFEPVADGDVKQYQVYCSVNGASNSLVGTVNAGTSPLTFDHTGISPMTKSYSYYVTATDSCGGNVSASSTTHQVVALDGSSGNQRIDLNWTKYVGFTTKTLVVQKWVSGAWKDWNSMNVGDTNWTDTVGLNCNKNIYRIKSVSSTGFTSYSDSISLIPIDTIKPPATSIIRITADLSFKGLKIDWNANAAKDVTRYIIYRSVNGGSFSPIDTVTKKLTYTDTSALPSGNHYCYYITALDSCAGNEGPAGTAHCDVYLQGSFNACSHHFTLKWTGYSGWSAVTGYEIYRTVSGTETLIATVSSTDSVWVDSTLSAKTYYTYRVKAIGSAAAEYSFSDTTGISYTVIAGPDILSASVVQTSTTSGQVQLAWDATTGNKAFWFSRLYHSSSGAAGSYSLVRDSILPTQTTYIDTGRNTKTSDNWYYMTSVDSCGAISDSLGYTKTMDLSLQGGQLTNLIWWTPYKGHAVSYYVIERLDTGASFVRIDSLPGTDTAYTDNPAPCYVEVFYRVTAYDAFGNYSWSDTAGTQALDTIPAQASAITNVTVINNSVVRVSLTTGPDALDVYGFSLRRSLNGGGWFERSFFIYAGPNSSFTFDDTLNTLTDSAEYQFITLDSCLNYTPSDTFAEVQLYGWPGNQENYLQWSPFEGYAVDWYRVQVDNGSGWVSIDSVPGNIVQYRHYPLPCYKTVKYRIEVKENGGSRTSLSDNLWLTPFDTVAPQPPDLIYASVISNGLVELAWHPSDPDVGTYQIDYQTANGSWTTYGTVPASDTLATLSGLNTLDSTLSFRVVALDSCSNNASRNNEVHTLVQLHGAAGQTAVQLSWSLYTGASVSSQEVQQWINGSWTTVATVSKATASFSDTALACNVAVYYRIASKLPNNTWVYSDSVALTPYDSILPEAPVMKYVTVLQGGQTYVAWQPSASKDVTTYQVWRKDEVSGYALIGTVSDTFYQDASASASKMTYCYYIRAVDSCNTSNVSSPSDSDCTMKVSLSQLGCVPGIILDWQPYVGFTGGAVNQEIWRQSAGTWTKVASVPDGTNTWIDSSVSVGTTYCYYVLALDPGGNYTSATGSQCINPSLIPLIASPLVYGADVSVTDAANGSVVLTWPQSNDTFARGYQVLYRNGPKAGWKVAAQFGLITDTVWNQTGINTTTGFSQFALQVLDGCGRYGDTSVFHDPINLGITKSNLNHFVHWTPYVGMTPDGYVLYRSRDGINYAAIANLTAADTSWNDSLLSCGVTFYYFVAATSGSRSFRSDIDTATAFDTIPPAPIQLVRATVTATSSTYGQIQVDFNAAPEMNVSGYRIHASKAGSNLYSSDIYRPGSGILSYSDGSLDTRIWPYSWWIEVLDSCGNVSQQSDTHTTMVIQVGAVNDAMNISWTAYGGFAQPEYTIYRSMDGGVFQPLFSGYQGLSWTDSTVICHHYYTYRIDAGNAPLNNTVSQSDTAGALAFEITPPDAPVLDAASVVRTHDAYGSVQLTWEPSVANDLDHYTWFVGDGVTFRNMGILPKGNSAIVSGLDTRDSAFTFYLMAIDSCGNISPASNTHTSIQLNGQAGEQSVGLSFTPYQGFLVDHYEVWRDGAFMTNLNRTVTNWVDTPLSCIRGHHYFIKAFSVTGGFEVWSDSVYVVPLDHIAPDSVSMDLVTVSDPNRITALTWYSAKAFDVAKYEVYRKEASQTSFKFLAVTSDTFFLDSNWNASVGYCYYITTLDSCGNRSIPSLMLCPIHLEGKAGDFVNDLKFTGYRDWPAGADYYELHRSVDGGLTYQNLANLGNVTYAYADTALNVNARMFDYRIFGFELNGTRISASNKVSLVQQPIIWIPNAFSPSTSPDLNDVFGPAGLFFTEFDLEVFDRWGGLVFRSSPGKLFWDGKDKAGNVVPQGAFFYMVKVTGFDGKWYFRNGTVTKID